MTLNLCVLTPNRIVWDSEVKEIILSTNSGQIGVLPNHAPIATAVDIDILRIRLNDQWLTMALMGGFARIGNNEITVLVNARHCSLSGQLLRWSPNFDSSFISTPLAFFSTTPSSENN
ncbi:putative H(+)-transporting two-sector ATPase [Rosa chinensis]|uniref:Putative H(+)-transporting two-sector ATPase n=1 Tax=Rosa chinensis TaxID=74649 RepID=A0A2P6RHL7_ROSCH|nr:putative H(+)-transporting two-sector ATPase [Rosa chinensis]